MATKSNRLVPARAIHPGEILREELQERGIKQKDFAQTIDVQPTHLNEFIKGKRNMNERLALKLEQSLGIPFDSWMSLHNGYIYACKAINERNEEEQEAIQYEEACAEFMNLKLLYKKLGMATMTCSKRVRKLKETFPFDLLSSYERKEQVAGLYKHSEKVQIDDKNMMTWLILNWLAIAQIKPSTVYQKGNGLIAAQTIAKQANERSLTTSGIKECLENLGISYIKIDKLDKTPIDAYSTFSNGHPIITVTYRYNDMDKLAFDIIHELYHIEHHLSDEHKAFIAIEGVEYSTDIREKEANDFARQSLIPDTIWRNILKVGCNSLSPYKIVKTIAEEAERYAISPSIAIARYKHDSNWYKIPSYKSPKIH